MASASGVSRGTSASSGAGRPRTSAKRDPDLGVRGLSGRRPCGRPGVLVPVDEQQSGLAPPAAGGGERAQQHRAVAADHQRQPSTVEAAGYGRAGRGDQVRQGGLVDQLGGPPHPGALEQLQVTGVAYVAVGGEPLCQARLPQDPDGVRDPARLCHRGVRHTDQVDLHSPSILPRGRLAGVDVPQAFAAQLRQGDRGWRAKRRAQYRPCHRLRGSPTTFRVASCCAAVGSCRCRPPR